MHQLSQTLSGAAAALATSPNEYKMCEASGSKNHVLMAFATSTIGPSEKLPGASVLDFTFTACVLAVCEAIMFEVSANLVWPLSVPGSSISRAAYREV